MNHPPVQRREQRFWIAVAPHDSVERAVAGGYVEINHGKAGPLERMHAGDGIAFYSPREHEARGAPLQAFTALGRVADAPLYQVAHDHQPFRRAVHWVDVHSAPVRPLLNTLGCVRNKSHWGAAFRFGFLRVSEQDFACIAAAMEADWLVAACTGGNDRSDSGATAGVAAAA